VSRKTRPRVCNAVVAPFIIVSSPSRHRDHLKS
jgi:hypothetical protein